MVSKMCVAVVVFASLVSTSVATAQACIGQMSLRQAHINGGADVHMVSQGKGAEARIAVGNAHTFANAGLGAILYDHGTTMKSYLAGAAGGYSIELAKSNILVCPVASLRYENGPDNAAIAQNTLTGTLGIFIGGTARMTSNTAMIMYGGGGYQNETYRYKVSNTSAASSFTSRGLNLQTGVGLQVRSQFLLRVAAHGFFPSLPEGYGYDAPVKFVVGLSYSPSRVQ